MKYTLVGEDPELTAAIDRLAVLARAEGVEFTTADFGGVRTEADTAQILRYRDDDYVVYRKRLGPDKEPVAKERWRPIAPFGRSFHNWGAARDLKPTKWPHGKSFQWAHDCLDRLVKTDPKLSKVLRLGDYFNDEPHVELNITLDEARRRYIARLNPPPLPVADGGN